MKAKDFDEKTDANENDTLDDVDLSSMRRANQQQKRVNVDFPVWMVASLDHEAARLGITRQSIIKVWLAERLEQQSIHNARATR
uniref:CopG antitoxin of type II toxin-antitoxin system n=1 Tax=Candidatus Kentrum sp. LFY TaxID=2126342 RepID=A0A450WWC0_9GAMM|nr:MAG: hypothetical protein BECKLFY1418C_GA0070996_109011 [Candidatus Kentron sp. LFY]